MKKKITLFLIFTQLFIPVFAYAEDQTPVQQKIEEAAPAPAENTQVPEEIKNQPVDTASPAEKPAVEGIVSGMEGASGGKPAKAKKGRNDSSIWPDDEKKLYFPQTDDGEKNSSFAAFREEFLQKLAEKDKAYLLSVIDKKIKFSFGNYADFKNFYSLDVDAKRSLIWDDLTKLLKLGGVFTPDGEFCAPYVYCLWPEGVRSNGMVAVIKDGVEIKKSPSKNSSTVGTIGYEIVKTNYNGAALRAGWTSIETRDGIKGFVRNDDVRNPEDYRAWFKEKDGKWFLTTYISGGF